MPAGRLRETENKRISQIFALKSGCGHLVAAQENVLKQYLREKQNGYFQSGRLQ